MAEIAKPETDIKIAEQILDEVLKTSVLVVHNDDHNTFDHVIECLVDVCAMGYEQAEQCTLIIHFKGKYGVREGKLEDLKPLKDALVDRGLSATIE